MQPQQQLNAIMRHLPKNFRQPEKVAGNNILLSKPKPNIDEIKEMLLSITHQQSNRYAITDIKLPPHNEQEIAEFRATSAEILHNLYHGQNVLEAITHAEMRVNLLKITLDLFQDTEKFQAAKAVYEDVQQELSDYQFNPDHEINRKNLDMLSFWFDLTATYAEFLPKKAFIEASIYNTGIQILHYMERLMSQNANEVAAAFRVIRNASVESCAVKHKLSPSKLRKTTLEIGQMLYRMGVFTEEYKDIQTAETIPKLRTHEYTELANLDNLKLLLQKAKRDYCSPFEQQFGLSDVKWDKSHHNITHGFIQIANKLNCE